MGAPIKINKDLLVITPNYTKEWLSEGQPKVSLLHPQVPLPLLPAPSQREPAKEPVSMSRRQKIKQGDCPSAPSQLLLSPALGHLILPLSPHDPAGARLA